MSGIPNTRPTKAWDPYTVDSVSKIEMVQRRSARYACSRYHNTISVSDMLSTLNWPTLAECRLRTRIIMIYKCVHQLVAILSGTILIPANSRTKKIHQQTLINIFTSKDIYRYSFFPYTVKQWNNLPEQVVYKLKQ